MTDPNKGFSGVPAWGDAGTVVPWRMYENYADARMLAEHFESARRWVDFIRRNNPNLLWRKNRGNDYNDWLNGDTLVLKDYPPGSAPCPTRSSPPPFSPIRRRSWRRWPRFSGGRKTPRSTPASSRTFAPPSTARTSPAEGKIKGDTQAGYALALSFNLLDEPLRAKAVEHLLAGIQRYKGHLSTGIQATHHAMLELSRNGRHDEACRLVCLRNVPSWGYMIDQGATTIWERWDGYVRGRGFQDPGMNSFNHWAFGAVGEWVWRELAGINPDEQKPRLQALRHPASPGRRRHMAQQPLRIDPRGDFVRLEARRRPADARRRNTRRHEARRSTCRRNRPTR